MAVLALKRDDLLPLTELSEFLSEAIEAATDFIIDCEVPLIDYMVAPSETANLELNSIVALASASAQNSKREGSGPRPSRKSYFSAKPLSEVTL